MLHCEVTFGMTGDVSQSINKNKNHTHVLCICYFKEFAISKNNLSAAVLFSGHVGPKSLLCSRWEILYCATSSDDCVLGLSAAPPSC